MSTPTKQQSYIAQLLDESEFELQYSQKKVQEQGQKLIERVQEAMEWAKNGKQLTGWIGLGSVLHAFEEAVDKESAAQTKLHMVSTIHKLGKEEE